jgi:hypothetical protein
MDNGNKRDLSISMLRANIMALAIGIPAAIVQLNIFVYLHGAQTVNINLTVLLSMLLFFVVLIGSVFVHELIHGLTWKAFGKRTHVTVAYGFQWKTLTPYAHLKEPVEINVYRIGGFMPGFVLGILPYLLGLVLNNSFLLWFGVIHTIAASGDWLVLWSLRQEKAGSLVEDHPSRAGCYVIETQESS